MKLKVFLMIAMVLPSIAYSKQHKSPVPQNVKKTYCEYTIVSMIDTELAADARKIEDFIRRSNFRKSYSAVTASNYHMIICPIYQCGNQLIPPVQRLANTTGQTFLYQDVHIFNALTYENEKAICLFKTYLDLPLTIKYAYLKFGTYMISVQLVVDKQSLQKIRYVRNELGKLYGKTDFSIVNEELHIVLAYANRKMTKLDPEEWNKLNRLVAPFNGAKLQLPDIYLINSMKNYVQLNTNIDCRAVSWSGY